MLVIPFQNTFSLFNGKSTEILNLSKIKFAWMGAGMKNYFPSNQKRERAGIFNLC